MGFGWKDIVPGDPYVVRLARPISPTELIHITQLYQPLIGPLSASLYITLYHEKSIDQGAVGSHRFLMSVMATSLDKLIKAREVLEAIGLLRAAKLTTDSGENLYEYLLQPPLQPPAFFGDGIMSMILLNRIGKTRYKYLREKFVGSDLSADFQGAREDITKSFDEIFEISPTELRIAPGSETEHFFAEMESAYPVGAYHDSADHANATIRFKKKEIDYVFLEASLPKTYGGNRLTQPVREVIKELAFFYQLDDMQLSYFLQEPSIFDDRSEVDPEMLRKVIKEWYMQHHKGGAPQVEVAATIEKGTDIHRLPELTREEEHKLALSQMSPISLLEHYQGGGKVSPADIKIVDELAQQYKLTPGVINVLLEYVMMTNNKQLPKALILKIATHWKRLAIQTVDEALDQAKQLYHEIKSRGKAAPKAVPSKGNQPKSNNSKKSDLPEWVVRQLKESSHGASVSEEIDAEKKREAIELLKALGEID